MMKKREYMLWVVSFYVLSAALLLVGTFYDLQIDKALYNPENAFVLFFAEIRRGAALCALGTCRGGAVCFARAVRPPVLEPGK